MTLKRAINKPKALRGFTSFIKERDYSDSPYEIASQEAENLLGFIENILKQSNKNWKKDFINGLRKGNGEYEVISPGVYVVKSGFTIWAADIPQSKFTELTSGYDLEVKDQGVMPDGTGWILCRYSGLSRGVIFSGYNLITYIENNKIMKLESTPLVNESTGYSENDVKKGTYAYYCGEGEYKIEEVAGEILDYKWKDIDNNGHKDIVFNVEEYDCGKSKSKLIKKTIVFSIKAGKVFEIK